MDIVLIILAVLCLLIGIVGCIIPALPGVPLAYVALWLLHITDRVQFSWQFLLVWGIVMVVVQIMDYIIPAWGTKRTGGSKAGVWGSTIGLLVGLFFGPWGIVLGPFIGAVIAELLAGKNTADALRSGWGSLLGLLTGTILKLICCGLMAYYFVAALI